jgi:hypothetical protein
MTLTERYQRAIDKRDAAEEALQLAQDECDGVSYLYINSPRLLLLEGCDKTLRKAKHEVTRYQHEYNVWNAAAIMLDKRIKGD